MRPRSLLLGVCLATALTLTAAYFVVVEFNEPVASNDAAGVVIKPEDADSGLVIMRQTQAPEELVASATAAEPVKVPQTSVDPFRMVGVTWDRDDTLGEVTVHVQVRQSGVWSDWTALGTEDTGEGRPGTEPLWLEVPADAVSVEVTASAGVPQGIRATTIEPGTSEATAEQTEGLARPAAATGLTNSTLPTPAIWSRSSWGAGPGTTCSAPTTAPKTLGVVLHHTAGANAQQDSAAVIRGYQSYHINGHGWCDIGYHFLVDWSGQIFEGRKGGFMNQVRGAHAGDSAVNTHATGVAMMGNFDLVEPPAAMKSSVVELIAWRLSYNDVDPLGTYIAGGKTYNVINGHRDVVATACPGRYGYAWISASGGLRERVASLVSVDGSAAIDAEYALRQSVLGAAISGHLSLPGGSGRAYALGSIYWTSSWGARSVFGPIKDLYFARGGATGPLGFPSSNIDDYAVRSTGGAGQGQAFAGGSVFTYAKGTFEVPTSMRTPWSGQWGGLAGVLGWPVSAAAAYPANGGGTGQAFEGGSMFTSAAGSFAVTEPFRGVWVAAGGVAGQWGWPVSNADRYAANGGGTGQAFQNASMFTSPAGTFAVQSQVRTWWVNNGGVAGPFGWPISAMTCVGTACSQNFQNGLIQIDTGTGAALTVTGAQHKAYQTAGDSSASLGPVISRADQYGANGGGTGQAFQNGSIFTTAAGSHVVSDPIRSFWVASLGGIAGPFGWPITNGIKYTPNGGGIGQAFQQGSVFTSIAGTFPVSGAIRTNWVNRGGVASAEGWPIGEPGHYIAVGGVSGTGQAFQQGSVFTSSLGTFAVTGTMRTTWVNNGGIAGTYGWPTSTMTCTGDTCTQKFQRGTLTTTR